MSASPRSRQQGVALITAILLVAIATALATKIAWDNQLNVRRTESALNIEQARQFALGAEAVAIDQLIQHRVNNAYDYIPRGENPLPNIYTFGPITLPLELEGEVVGQMTGVIADAHNRFNLNNLVDRQGTIDEQAVEGLRELFEQPEFRDLGINRTLVDAIVDWIDNDTVPQGAGVEDGSYTSLDPPYRPANNYLSDVSELRSVFGVSQEAYNVLQNFVTAIPPGWCGTAGDPSGVNVNLLQRPNEPVERAAAILSAALNIGRNEAANVLQAIPAEGWNDLSPFSIEVGAAARNQRATENASTFAVIESTCTELRVTAVIGTQTLTMYSLLDRLPTGRIVTRVRAFGLD